MSPEFKVWKELDKPRLLVRPKNTWIRTLFQERAKSAIDWRKTDYFCKHTSARNLLSSNYFKRLEAKASNQRKFQKVITAVGKAQQRHFASNMSRTLKHLSAAWDWPLSVDELFKVAAPTGVLVFEAPVPDEADVFAGSADRGSCLSFRVILSWKTSRSLSIYTSKTCVASGSQVRTESVNKERGKRQKIRQTLLLQLSIFWRKAHRSSRYRAEEKVFKQFNKLADSDRETKACQCSHQYILKGTGH